MLGHWADRESASALALALFAGASAAGAANPVVDRQSPSAVTSISREQLDRLPAGQRIEDLVRTCPSTTFPTLTRDPQMLVDGQRASIPFSINCLAPADVALIEVYKTHNAARAEYGAPPLARDPLLELSAGEYVGQLARTGKMVHASRAGRGNIRENISQGMPGWSAGQLVGSWVKEKKNFVPGTFPNVSRTGNWYDIGHWAQMIWIRTVVIGCARAAGIGAVWMVCRYGPGGNRDGEQVGIPPQAQKIASRAPTRDDSVEPCDGPPDANGEVPINRADCGEDVAGSEVDTKVQTPKLPQAEVFSRKTAVATYDQSERKEIRSLFDIYDFAGPLLNDWFGPRIDIYDVGPSLSEDIPLMVGEGSAVGGYNDGATEEALGDTKVQTPKLPQAEVFSRKTAAATYDQSERKELTSLFDLYNYPGGPIVHYLWDFEDDPDDGIKVCQLEPSIALAYDVGQGLSALGSANYILPLSDGTANAAPLYPDGPNPPTSWPGLIEEKYIDKPGLPGKEVYNPADLPQCPLDIM